MTADEIIEVLDRAYWQCIGPQPTLAQQVTKARVAVAEIIRENQALKREILGARHGGRTPQIVWDTGSDGRQQEKGL